MRTARSLPYGREVPDRVPALDRDPPWQRPLDRDPPSPGQTPMERPPGQRPPTVMWPVVHAGTETPPLNRMTHRRKNIILSQTSFAGGKNGVCLKPYLQLNQVQHEYIKNIHVYIYVTRLSRDLENRITLREGRKLKVDHRWPRTGWDEVFRWAFRGCR